MQTVELPGHIHARFVGAGDVRLFERLTHRNNHRRRAAMVRSAPGRRHIGAKSRTGTQRMAVVNGLCDLILIGMRHA